MYELIDTVHIACSPETVYSKLVYYFQSSKHYKEWHKDRLSCQWIKGKDFSETAVLYAGEVLGNKTFNLQFRITRNEPLHRIEYKFLFPLSLICTGGYFYFDQVSEGTELQASLQFRIPKIFTGLFRKHINDLKVHMQEEGLSIKKTIEGEKETTY